MRFISLICLIPLSAICTRAYAPMGQARIWQLGSAKLLLSYLFVFLSMQLHADIRYEVNQVKSFPCGNGNALGLIVYEQSTAPYTSNPKSKLYLKMGCDFKALQGYINDPSRFPDYIKEIQTVNNRVIEKCQSDKSPDWAETCAHDQFIPKCVVNLNGEKTVRRDCFDNIQHSENSSGTSAGT